MLNKAVIKTKTLMHHVSQRINLKEHDNPNH